MEQSPKRAALALMPELAWASSDWGFDYYSMPVPLDFFCGVHDAQAPFALVLAARKLDARFHYFSFGHHGFPHPDARCRILVPVSGYFDFREVRAAARSIGQEFVLTLRSGGAACHKKKQ